MVQRRDLERGWLVRESDVEDAHCRGHVVIDTGRCCASSATASCLGAVRAATEGGACAGAVHRRYPLYWPAEGTTVSKTFLEGAYEKNGVTTPDGFPVYESRLVDGLELLRCDEAGASRTPRTTRTIVRFRDGARIRRRRPATVAAPILEH